MGKWSFCLLLILSINLGGCGLDPAAGFTRANTAARLQELAGRMPPGGWVIGYGYDDTNFGGHLSRQDSDRLVADHPVLLIHGSLFWSTKGAEAIQRELLARLFHG